MSAMANCDNRRSAGMSYVGGKHVRAQDRARTRCHPAALIPYSALAAQHLCYRLFQNVELTFIDATEVAIERHEGESNREKQLLIDFLCSSAGGSLYYMGRDMKTSHKGMRISESDWSAFLGHVSATLEAFQLPQLVRDQVVASVQSTKADIVEA